MLTKHNKKESNKNKKENVGVTTQYVKKDKNNTATGKKKRGYQRV